MTSSTWVERNERYSTAENWKTCSTPLNVLMIVHEASQLDKYQMRSIEKKIKSGNFLLWFRHNFTRGIVS